MSRIVNLLLSIVIVSFISSFAFAADTNAAITEQQQNSMTPLKVLQLLKSGNQRFLDNKVVEYDFHKLAGITAKKGQDPIAIILSCVDSRGVPEILFDKGVGNIFVARIAGNIVNDDILGSMEFATKVYSAKLIVVMGHTSCGAVAGACANIRLGHVTSIVKAIQPAVQQVRNSEKSKFNCESPLTVDAIAKQNVLDQLHNIQQQSPIIDALIKEKKVMLVGAMQTLATGKVTFFDSTGKAI